MELFNGKYKRLAARLDGESRHADAGHAGDDPELRAYADAIRAQRAAIAPLRQTPRIEDAQFRAFFDGVREGIDDPARGRARQGHGRGWLAALSLVAAALVVAVSAFVILDGGPQAVQANVVEYVATDLEGARFDVYDSDEGVTTIWMVSAGDDL